MPGTLVTHDAQAALTFEFHFSEEPGISCLTLLDHSFAVTNGTITECRRLDMHSK